MRSFFFNLQFYGRYGGNVLSLGGYMATTLTLSTLWIFSLVTFAPAAEDAVALGVDNLVRCKWSLAL
jgi:hypothetical protein